MNTLSYKTVHARKEDIVRKWYVVDAEGEVVGRMSSKIAHILRGKHKVSYTPHVDCGDYVIVINADKVRFTGKKMTDKIYSTYSGYPGGQKLATPREVMQKFPRRCYRRINWVTPCTENYSFTQDLSINMLLKNLKPSNFKSIYGNH